HWSWWNEQVQGRRPRSRCKPSFLRARDRSRPLREPAMSNWTENDHLTPEQEREIWAREECERRGVDPDEICADGGVVAWMVVAQEPRPSQASLLALLRDARAYLGGTNPLVMSGG